MFARIANGWELTKQSLQVLRSDKELLVFPLMSGVACLLVLGSFALPLWMSGYVETFARGERQANDIGLLGYAVLFLFYLANYFVIVFFNSALVACAVIRFRGGDPTVSDGLGAAMARLPQIFGWALVAASVGVLLKAIENRSEKVGSIVAGLMGMGWSIVTFFVIPVIVVEKAGPIKAIERSTAIIRRAWGESLVANLGMGLFIFLFNLPAIALVFGGVALMNTSVPLGAALLALGIVGMLFVSLISSALNAIVLAALYLYAVSEQTPSAFGAAQLQAAFARR